MNDFLLISQIIVSISLMILILLQQRGSSLGSAFGGTGEFYSARRGAEKKIFWATVVLGTVFITLALLNITT
jgi:preprotein translocase subunit SecG